jgi:dUTP pyrophosphatase
MRLAVRRLAHDAVIPTRAYAGDAGFDLYAAESSIIHPGERGDVGTGIAIELPERHAGMVLPRSGLAARYGISLVNAPGLIDPGYRGELRVLLLNTDRARTFEVRPGDRIAQLVVVRVETPDVVEVAQLAVSQRAERGFGSSDVSTRRA